MERLSTHLVLAAVALLVLGILPRHWWTAEGREVGLLSERVCRKGGGKDCETRSHGSQVDGWWPTAGLATLVAGLVAVGGLLGALILARLGVPVRPLGYLGMAASALAGVAGLAFVLGKPSLFAETRINMGVFLLLLGAPFGVLAGLMLGRG